MWIVVNLLTNEVLSDIVAIINGSPNNPYTTDVAFSLDPKYAANPSFKYIVTPKKFLLLHDARKALFEYINPSPDELLHYEFVLLDKNGNPIGSTFPRNKNEASYNKRYP